MTRILNRIESMEARILALEGQIAKALGVSIATEATGGPISAGRRPDPPFTTRPPVRVERGCVIPRSEARRGLVQRFGAPTLGPIAAAPGHRDWDRADASLGRGLAGRDRGSRTASGQRAPAAAAAPRPWLQASPVPTLFSVAAASGVRRRDGCAIVDPLDHPRIPAGG